MTNEHEHHHCLKYMSWNGIIVGALVAVGLSFLFQILTVGLGLSSVTRDEQGMDILAVSGFIWLFVGGYIILFIAGWIGAKISTIYSLHVSKGVLFGFLVWALALVISFVATSEFTESMFTPTSIISASSHEAFRAVQSEANPVMTEPTQKAIQKVGFATLSTFFVFLAGALGSCIGAYMGMRDNKDMEHLDSGVNPNVRTPRNRF